MLANRREVACSIIDVSGGGLAISVREKGSIGEAVVVYIDRVGRLQGEIVRQFDGGFAIRLTGTSRAADELLQRYAVA